MGPFLVIERRDDGVALVRLQRPPANALSAALLEELAEAATALAADPPGAVVVTGSERIFAAGADIGEFTVGDGDARLIGPDGAAAISARFHRALGAVAALPRVTIAAVSGYALGGGCELALACDLRVADETARLGLPEILLGLIPGGGGTQRLARLVGPARAKDLILTGRQVGAEEALRMGLVDRVVPAGQGLTAALELAASLARGPVRAHALVKRAVDRGLDGTLDEGLRLEGELFAEVFGTDDAAAGVRSFLERGPGKAAFHGR